MYIKQIESLTESQAKEMALEVLTIKDHQIYLVDFGGYFGYSALVFKNGKHIHYANDYALHHSGRDREWLRDWYIKTLNNKLFTDAEIGEPLKSYEEFKAKEYFLRNYYPMQTDYVSCFRICCNEAEERDYKKSIEGKHFNRFSFCYMDDLDFIIHQADLFMQLMNCKANVVNNYEYQKNAFKSEMYNHEYAINWEADTDTLSAFGNIPYKRGEYTLTEIFDILKFNDIQRKAYLDAKREYYKEIGEEYY